MSNVKTAFRPTAVPLITVDPYFSLWSFSETLTDDHIRHWSGRRQGMCGLLRIDGKCYTFLGKFSPDDEMYVRELPRMKQTALRVTPTSTYCTMETDEVVLDFAFTTPLLLDHPEILSRPVTYFDYSIEVKDGKEHKILLYLDLASECVTTDRNKSIVYRPTETGAYFGVLDQKPFSKSGDGGTIEWGYIHVAHPEVRVSHFDARRDVTLPWFNYEFTPFADRIIPADERAALAVMTEKREGVITFAYDDIFSVKYFGETLPAYYREFDKSFDAMLKDAAENYPKYRKMADEFSEKFTAEMQKYGDDFREIGALLYRQTIAAHKLVKSEKDGVLFLSKECDSGGFIGTLDVTYPSIPLYLLFNTEYVKGMLRPIFRYAKTDEWEFPFAPHDVGFYPICEGQMYEKKDGKHLIEYQMPVEECGNALLTVAAICRAEGKKDFAMEHKDQLIAWAEYLCENGYNPGNQLCTDDFAGHLAHNCNLSAKAIVAIGAAGDLFDEPKYTAVSKEMAANWCKDAKRDGVGTRLTFDNPDGWSLKYNLVWDKFLGLSLFPEEIYRDEIKVYREKMNRYGVPLDCRCGYTKLDWLVWTTVLTDDKEYFDEVMSAARRMICESADRVPVTDWYQSESADKVGFQNRTVVGGCFIPMLKDKFKNK